VTYNDRNGNMGIEQSIAGGVPLNQRYDDDDERRTAKERVILTYRDQNNCERKIVAQFDNNGITKTVRFIPDI
jgi:hypothetical protein